MWNVKWDPGVRDKGPDYRGFVQLPLIQSSTLTYDESILISQSTALCFVEPCQRNFNSSILQCHERDGKISPVLCNHIKAALRCFSEAVPLAVNTSVLEILNIADEIKKDVWNLLSEAVGPVVQRVSKNIMAVKCKASPKHPLGYLHFSFNMTIKGESENHFSCSCSTFKENVKTRNKEEQIRCPHFYACICAFVNNVNLCEEFSSFIKLEIPLLTPLVQTNVEMFTKLAENDPDPLSKILNESECKVEVFREDVGNILSENITEDEIIFSSQNDINSQSIGSLKVAMDSDSLGYSINKSSFLEDITNPCDINTKELVPIEGETLISTTTMDLPATSLISSIDLPSLNASLDLHSITSIPSCIQSVESSSTFSNVNSGLLLETVMGSDIEMSDSYFMPQLAPKVDCSAPVSKVNLNFTEWLGTVTETINQHMHYQFDGKPNPLVFHVPQKFFEKLKERIIFIRKKKVPTNVTTFTRKDSIPMGTFTKYTWSLTNIMHVRYVFDTPHMPLKIFRAFVKDKDGSFVPSWENFQVESEDGKNNHPILKPAQYKTFIRVGLTSVDQLEPTPFKIEWIPDVLPLSHIGELRIQFEFGHIPHPKTS
ncbi:conserved hypothetical protein [Pediculus humanus corporis]|uniref:SWIM-type domain-containing protein n=1 Tax=Pediculus humanus subsp. corporis TaxID=121224 RepID=E0VWV2_PEDHC|nr:uncharacterized protein Phum_PHUM491260 [Pediculus humanus corporis]EEB17858.1 conserved hypothetical protein [Pediculus humanus corporis]